MHRENTWRPWRSSPKILGEGTTARLEPPQPVVIVLADAIDIIKYPRHTSKQRVRSCSAVPHRQDGELSLNINEMRKVPGGRIEQPNSPVLFLLGYLGPQGRKEYN